ncbi:MAG TPA: hypothetical protein VGQ02_10760 [Candidatus Limnocylindrales bacterium]|nr:hypothetical protein [Candidatus Limnocylindrales bacterium]
MTDATGRAQDQGRRHRRKGSPSPETASLLADWQDTLRTELRAVTVELRGKVQPGGLLPDAGEVIERPSLTQRVELVRLGVMVANALGTEVDRRPAEPTMQSTRPRRRSRVDYG